MSLENLWACIGYVLSHAHILLIDRGSCILAVVSLWEIPPTRFAGNLALNQMVSTRRQLRFAGTVVCWSSHLFGSKTKVEPCPASDPSSQADQPHLSWPCSKSAS